MANRDEQEAEIRRNFLGRSSLSLSSITEQHPDNLSFPTLEDIPIPVIRDVDMILGEQSASTGSNHNYTAFQLSLECGKKEDVTCRDQRATYYLGGICCLMPEVTDDILEGVRQSGSRVRIVRVFESSDLMVPPKKAYAFFGYLVTMLYKNLTEENFRGFSDRCLKALFDAAGYAPKEGEDVSVFNDVKHAMTYQGYGQEGRIRKAVLKGILNNSKVKDSFGEVCSYVAKILSWTGMAGFYKVYNTLALTDSNVLSTRGLASEVENLQRAVKAVFDTQMPQYFRILNNYDYNIVASSKFPKLVAVPEKIMMTSTDVSSLQFETGFSDVDYYVAVHKNQFSLALSVRLMQYFDKHAEDDEV